jgi:hypothetical protein
MTRNELDVLIMGQLLDESLELEFEEFCRVCHASEEFVVALVAEGVIEPQGEERTRWVGGRQQQHGGVHLASQRLHGQRDLVEHPGQLDVTGGAIEQRGPAQPFPGRAGAALIEAAHHDTDERPVRVDAEPAQHAIGVRRRGRGQCECRIRRRAGAECLHADVVVEQAEQFQARLVDPRVMPPPSSWRHPPPSTTTTSWRRAACSSCASPLAPRGMTRSTPGRSGFTDCETAAS